MKHPFSNNTEWEMWATNWCYRCLVDAPFQNGISSTGCPLILYALTHDESPPEWLEQPDTVANPGDRFHCVNFKGRGYRNPEPKPQTPPPGQDGLFPAEPYRGTRMLTRTPQRQRETVRR